MRDQAIFRILRFGVFVEGRAQLVSLREHDHAVHLLDGPAAFDKSPGEIIEQFGVGGTLAETSVIVWSTDDAIAEVSLPDAVRHDARRQRIAGIDNPVGQLEASAFRLDCGSGSAEAQDQGNRAFDGIAEVVIVAADEDFLIHDLALLDGTSHGNFFGGESFFKLGRLREQCLGVLQFFWRKGCKLFVAGEVQRAAVLPDGGEEGIFFRSQFRVRTGDLAGIGKVVLRLLPPAQILIVLISATAEIFLILIGDVLAVCVGGGEPPGELGTIAILQIIDPASQGLCVQFRFCGHGGGRFAFRMDAVSGQQGGGDLLLPDFATVPGVLVEVEDLHQLFLDIAVGSPLLLEGFELAGGG